MNNNTEHEVTGCKDCYLYDWDSCDCNHPDKPSNTAVIYADEIVFPSWCPLLKSSLTISIKNNQHEKA